MPAGSFEFKDLSVQLEPASGWRLDAGRLTQDERDDLLGYHPTNGSVWVGANTGDDFAFDQWATLEPADGWMVLAADVTGGGRADLVAFDSSTGNVEVRENLEPGFGEPEVWATLEPADDQWWLGSAFFTGAAGADLVAYHPSTGILWVGANAGDGFDFAEWATVPERFDGWRFVAGDLSGTAHSDVFGFQPAEGTLWLFVTLGESFEQHQVGLIPTAGDWQFVAGAFTGRGKADLLGYNGADGQLRVAADIAEGVRFESWGTAAPATGDWQLLAATFDGDLWSDVVGYLPDDSTLAVGRTAIKPIEGYCWPLSAAPGEVIAFRLSALGDGSVTYNRHRSLGVEPDPEWVGEDTFTAEFQPTPAGANSAGAGWDTALELDVPAEWRSGIFSATFIDGQDNVADITFVVRPMPSEAGGVAVLANVNTWLAYNAWGGGSKYTTGTALLSFLRPNPGAAPGQLMHLARGEIWVVAWLESIGHRPDVLTDIDFHNEGCDPSVHRCLMVTTHPEYWTTDMYDNLAAYLDGGGSLAYLGGNGVFETGEYEPGQTQMRFQHGVDNAPRTQFLFRTADPPRPERALLGVATERCGVPGFPYRVREEGHELFAGTGVAHGTPFGSAGVHIDAAFGTNGMASGFEVDTVEGPGAVGIPFSCAMGDEIGAVVPPSTPPEGLTILATADAEPGTSGSDLVYYDHPGGGHVLSAGSLTFGGSLVVDPVIQRVVSNFLAKVL
jgi:hypothetical protein